MSKRKGSRNEHKARKILQAAGYHTTCAAGSLGMFDVIAINAQGIRLVQVKSNRDASPRSGKQSSSSTDSRRIRRRKSGSSGIMRGTEIRVTGSQ